MTSKQRTSIAIVAALAITWSLFACLLAWGLMNDHDRTRQLGALALERVIGVQQSRLTRNLEGIEKDLRQEAAFASAHDSLGPGQLVDRWQPLLEGEWSLRSISLVDEGGAATTLRRVTKGWRCSVTNGPGEIPLIWEWLPDGSFENARPGLGEPGRDPRRALWFGEALGNNSALPVWTMHTTKDSSYALDLGQLVRGRSAGGAYRVLNVSVDPERLLRDHAPHNPLYMDLYLGPDDRPWALDTADASATVARLAISRWASDRTAEPFALETGGTSYLCRIADMSIGSSRIRTGAILKLDTLTQWTDRERLALKVAAVLLLLIGALVTWALLRSRRVDRLVERSEKRSRTQERKLAKAINEREILDREVHHRVKNNLQVVSSILNLQADRIADRQAKLEYVRGKRRIDSMALVHHKLYAQSDLRNVDMGMFLEQVANAMKAMFEPNSRSVSHAVDTADVKLNADTTIQVGIVLCELLTNCYQHAFPYVTGGHIDIQLRQDVGEFYRMSVTDNGKGLLRDPDRASLELGLELVEALVDQIDGRMEITTQNGTRVDIYFKMQGDGSMRTI